MQIQDIIELMKQMSKTGVSLVEFEHEGARLRLERPQPAGNSHAVQDTAGNTVFYQTADSQIIGAEESAAAGASDEEDGLIVTAPVVGVFYAAPSPEDDPFVQVGSGIEAGATLCIIEAMKLMNEVTSSRSGVVSEIFVTNGQRVEYGQPLMRIGG